MAIPDVPQLWRWVNENVLAIVCKKAVYHIDITSKVGDPSTLVFSK